MNENRFFIPPSLEWQQKLCSKFAVAHIETRELYEREKKNLRSPSSYRTIKGDGNCLFRALVYAICGNEENHGLIRQLIVSHLAEKTPWILNNETPDLYLERTKMCEDETWGTEVELYTASSLFQCRIFVYSRHGESFKWLQIRPLAAKTISSVPLTNESIYLYHRSGCHDDIVKDVGDKNEPDMCFQTKTTIVLDDSTCIKTVSFHRSKYALSFKIKFAWSDFKVNFIYALTVTLLTANYNSCVSCLFSSYVNIHF